MGIFSPAEPDSDAIRLQELCGIVDLGIRQFHRVGLALEEIRDRQLYRTEAKDFATFCQTRWSMSPQHAHRLIAAAALCRELGDAGTLIKTENQARHLRTLEPDQRGPAMAIVAETGESVASVTRKLSPGGCQQSKKGRLRAIRFRVPGGTVVIEPNKRFHGAEATLNFALDKLRSANAA